MNYIGIQLLLAALAAFGKIERFARSNNTSGHQCCKYWNEKDKKWSLFSKKKTQRTVLLVCSVTMLFPVV